jgi:transaldolase
MPYEHCPDIKIFVDCADFESIRQALRLPVVRGFTTNPSLVSQTGIADYAAYAKEVLTLTPALPVSFEVLSEDAPGMEREARVIRSWGDNVYVKIPVISAKGESQGPLIRRLSAEGIPLNVTTVFTPGQARVAAEMLDPDTPALVSVFAGRIADAGVDPLPIVQQCRDILLVRPRAELLWASTREVYNVWQAAAAGCRAITSPLSIVRKLADAGKDLTELSRDAVRAFMRDIAGAGIRFDSRAG